MEAKLIIFKLKIKSSYIQNIEQPADASFDTLQFFVRGDMILRIRTYVVDHDIHMHRIAVRNNSVEETIQFLITSTQEHYGDVIEKKIDIEIKEIKDIEAVKVQLSKEDLSPNVESFPEFLYWNPDNQKYLPKSNPL